MAWNYDHIFYWWWGVSALIWFSVDLILGFIVLLCTVISTATTKLIRSLGLSCHSHEADKGMETRASGKHLQLCPNPQGTSTLDRQLSNEADMSFICEECARHLSDCVCSSTFHSFDEIEGGTPVANKDDDDDQLEYWGLKELREALREERKAARELYSELEQERSASATAANEAMAMITRLQEEKALAQMECRQFQRMAEETQLYEQETIAHLHDILVRRDQEIFRLEEEAKLYRQKLLALTLDELVDPSGGLEKTLLLEGSEERDNERDSREERLLSEIREWVTAANEKVGPAVKGMEQGTEEKTKFPWKIINKSANSGRKNLLTSFSSAGGDDDNQRDGMVSEIDAESEAGSADSAARSDDASAAVGSELFHAMMDHLRKEPRLRDEASLKTLNELEEKFQKQSRKARVRHEDNMRRIWKNTLRGFGPAAGEHTSSTAGKKAQMEDITDYGGLLSGIVRDAEANRAMEQKRISVLEYVWKFEGQLHQNGTKKPTPHLGLTSSSETGKLEKPVESALNDQLRTTGSSIEFSATELEPERLKRRRDGSRLPPSRFRGHFSETDPFQVKDEAAPSPRSAVEFQKGESDGPFRHEDEELSEDSLVHDVYEVQRDLLETSTPKRNNLRYSDDGRKSTYRTSNKLMHGESAYSPESDACMEFSSDLGDRLGKPDPLPGYHSSEHKIHAKERSGFQAGTGRHFTSWVEDESVNQEFEWSTISTSNDDRYTAQVAGGRTPQTPSPTGKMDYAVKHLTAKLRTLEADQETMQKTISSLRAQNDEAQLLLDIAQQLRELRGMDQEAANSTKPREPTFASSTKGIFSSIRLRCTMQAQLNKLARVFLRHVDLGVCRGDQHVGLCRLLQISPQRPTRVTRGSKVNAEEIVLKGPQEGVLQQVAPRPSTLLSQQTWPIGVRERSGTALSGWDY